MAAGEGVIISACVRDLVGLLFPGLSSLVVNEVEDDGRS
jgi:hypothetical protein